MLDNFEIQSGKFIGVCVSLDNCRLFIGSIPRDKSKNDVLAEMKKVNTFKQVCCASFQQSDPTQRACGLYCVDDK